MGMVREDGMDELPCAAEAIKEGYVYKVDGSYNATKIASVTDVPIAVAAESTVDATGTAKTLTAGEKAVFYMMGCGKKVKVASAASMTYRRGAKVYTGQTADADGTCNPSSSNSAVCFGHYFGPDNITTSSTAGQLIDVLLDVQGA